MSTNVLEINTHHIAYPSPKKQHMSDFGYHSADEISFTSSPTTSVSSRRSSFSSFSSYHTRTSSQRHSLPPPPPPQRYTTLKSAHERIEYLEDQIKTRRESNENVIKGMTFQIDTFLKSHTSKKKSDPLSYCSTDSSLDPVIDTLNELKQLVTQHNLTITQDSLLVSPAKENQIIFSTQIIEKWIHSATQHKSKQVPQNVERAKYQKIVQDIQTLSQQHTQTKKQLRKVALSESKVKLKLQEQTKLNETIQQDKIEIEQLLDEVRNEMEDMMEELHSVKLDRERYFEKSQRFEIDLKDIKQNEEDADILALQGLLRESETLADQLEADYQDQIASYASKTESLKAQLKKAERSVAELSLVMEVQKRQQLSTEMEQALRRTLAERDGELAKTQFKLEKSYLQAEQMRVQQEKQMQLELSARLEAVEVSLKSHYKKETGTFQLDISREVRELSGKIMELENELEDYYRQHEQDTKQSTDARQKVKELQSALDANEKSSKNNIHNLEAKVKVLEGEVLFLYGKNLELAQHLGELDE
ncbi:hypothetical protein HPULCUR_000898 [Helicostylum pulchrum]|uniref:Uncharacterized protein n=1 Tax=Helicostylum pulchrum TaxID=562976 RepID=A0ABP9XL80_9FUNG